LVLSFFLSGCLKFNEVVLGVNNYLSLWFAL